MENPSSLSVVLLSLSLLLLLVSPCAAQSDCPNGNCTVGFAGIYVGCTSLECSAVPPLDSDTRWYLKTLELQDNEINELPKMEYKRMDVLDLHSNKLEKIDNQTFVGCEMLDWLDLSYNSIKSIHPNAFNDKRSIGMLNVSFNQLSIVPRLEMYSLDIFNMSHNVIEVLYEDVFTGLSRLDSLDLSYNKIDIVHSESFRGLRYLNDLHLQGNSLTQLTDNVFHTHMRGLAYLDLSHNKIQMVSHNAFTDLESLLYLDLSYNELRDVGDLHFLGLVSLNALFLHNNQIQNLSQGLVSECDELRILDVSFNPVKEVHPQLFVHKFARSIPLQTLRMNYLHDVTEIHNGTFLGLPDLVTVEIGHNEKLEVIQPAAFDPQTKSIKKLDLTYNKLSTLSETLLNWTRMDHVMLAGNTWDCNCHLAWMKDQSAFPAEFSKEVTCMYPRFLRHQTMYDISENKFSCNFIYEHRRTGAILLVMLVTIIFLVVAGFYLKKYRHRVFPCFYDTPMYRSFYNPLYTDGKDSDQIVIEPPPKPQRARKNINYEPTAV